MRQVVRMLTIAVVVAALPVVAFAGERVTLLEPEILVQQINEFPGVAQFQGPIMVRYEVVITNPSSEPITLRRIELKTISAVNAYSLRRESRPYAVTIAPGATVFVPYSALGTARGGMIGSMTPVDLNGIAWFDSPVGGTVKAFNQVIAPDKPGRRG